MKRLVIFILSFLLLSIGQVSAGWDPKDKSIKQERKVKETIALFMEKDPSLNRFFDNAYGYAIFPTVGKGAIVIGGAYGKGVVYQEGKAIGKTSLKQLSYGFQLGGQGYSEIIFFKDEAALRTFIDGNYEFSAGVSAVALTFGASAETDYSNGVAIFTATKGGLMYEASISGQKFKFKPYE